MSRDDDSAAQWRSVAAWTRGWQESQSQRTPLPSERYCVDSELGRGGMGVVHVATDRWLGRQVAIKRPREDVAVQKMMREAAITARLTHPSIAPVLDVGDDDVGPFYTMPILVGSAPCPSSPLFRWVQMVRDAALAVAHAHAQGIVHRDLKPDNLLWGDQYQLWVLDWGIAFDPASPDTAVVGTPGFAAPEQDEGLCSPASDVYGLGCVLRQHADLDSALVAVVERATMADPKARYRDGLALADELERWLAGGRVRAHQYTVGEVARTWLAQNRSVAVVTAIGLASVVALTIGVFVVQARAQARTNTALAESLVQRAESLSLEGARAEAEIYASHALSLAELPAARGVLMRWAATERPRRISVGPPVCSGLFNSYGERICVSDTEVALFGLDGVERARQTVEKSVSATYAQSDVAFFGDDVLTASPPMQWIGGEPTILSAPTGGARIADGPIPAFSNENSVFRVDLTSSEPHAWVETPCKTGVQQVLTHRDPMVVLCREQQMTLVTNGGTKSIEVPGFPVIAQWVGETLVVASFEGQLLLWDGSAWTEISTGAGPVSSAYALDERRLLVTTERMVTRVFDVTDQTWVLDLPRGFDAAVPTTDGVRGVHSDGVSDYALSWDAVGTGLDAAALGGVAAMELSPDGQVLAIGHAGGQLDLWNIHTGERERHLLEGGNVAKAMLWEGQDLRVNNGRGHHRTRGVWQHDESPHYARRFFAVDGQVVEWPTPARLRFFGRRADTYTTVNLWPTPSDLASDGDVLWSVDAIGQVSTIGPDGIQPMFNVGGFGRTIGVNETHIVLATEDDVLLYTRSGERLWSAPVSAPVTVTALDERFAVVGTQTGRVEVFNVQTGRKVAEHKPHTRRVSALILTQSELFTGSWDGTVTRMGVGPLTATPRSLKRAIGEDWSVGLDDLRD